jgi:hypothetical protein
MLKNVPEHLVPAIHRLKNTDDFLKLVDYLRDNQWYMADMACNSQGATSDEFSGAYRILKSFMAQMSLKEHNAPGVKGRHFE